MRKKRYRTVHMIANDAQVVAVLINGPANDFRETMARGEAHRVDNLRIVRNSRPRIVPPVETLPRIAPIA